MEMRVKKTRQVSPERAKIWIEPSPKHHRNRKVPVVYYLCRNHHLEHPHFIEVSLSSPEGLYLRDVINRLNVLRGKGMATMYSWSCKRSYRNGFVWQDLCEDDLILPAHHNEYVLKGSELLEESHSDHLPIGSSTKSQNIEQLQEPTSSRSEEASNSVSNVIVNETNRPTQEEELSPRLQPPNSTSTSPDSSTGKSHSSSDSSSLTEYTIVKGEGAVDASSQTEEHLEARTRETCTRGVSTDDKSPEDQSGGDQQNEIRPEMGRPGICQEDISPPPSSSTNSSCGRKTETLESLIKAEAKKTNNVAILDEEENCVPSNTKLKASDVLMQLISCGSLPMKDHSFGFIPNYRPRFSHAPFFSSSMVLREFDTQSENPSLRLEDKDYSFGTPMDIKSYKDEGLKHSLVYNTIRIFNPQDSTRNNEDIDSASSNCIFKSIKTSLTKQPKGGSMRSPVSDKPKKSSAETDSFKQTPKSVRILESSFGERLTQKSDKVREKDRVIKIEERLTSGARVVIQSNTLSEDSDGSS